MQASIWAPTLFGMLGSWSIQVPIPVALAILCAVAYIFCRRKPVVVTTDTGATLREAKRAGRVAKELEKIAEALRTDLASHRSRVVLFKERVASIQAEPNQATLQDLCREAEEILRPTMQLANQISFAYDELRQQTNHLMAFSEVRSDPLTGAHNRRSLDESLDSMFAMKARYGYTFSLMILDIDHFKKINDVHGHLAGDQVLKDVVNVVSELSRDTDLVARYGGEEFIVLLPSTPLEGSQLFAERVRSKIAEKLSVTISGGVTSSNHAENAKELVKQADFALYAAKEAGRNRVFVNDGEHIIPSDAPELVPASAAVESSVEDDEVAAACD